MIQWKQYNGALLLEGRPPHSNNDDVTIADAKKAMANGNGYFCRWTTQFDCGTETGWWYCIKDTPVDINSLTAKQRYRIKKGLNNWTIRRLTADNASDYLDDMYAIAADCFSVYPAKYRPKLDYASFCTEQLEGASKYEYWGAFEKDSNTIQGWAVCVCKDGAVSLVVVKIRPSVFNLEPNAALAYELCRYYLNEKGFKYVCDGERNIRHETNYQDFLCRVIGFRLAYCKLNIVYRKDVGVLVSCLRPFYRLINILGKQSKLAYNAASLLKMDRIARNVY